jgi:hypothetical protein
MELVQLGDSCLAALTNVRCLSACCSACGDLSCDIPASVTIVFKDGRRNVTLGHEASQRCWAGPLAPVRGRLTQIGPVCWLDLNGLVRVEKRKEGCQLHVELEFVPEHTGDPSSILTIDPEIAESVLECSSGFDRSRRTDGTRIRPYVIDVGLITAVILGPCAGSCYSLLCPLLAKASA